MGGSASTAAKVDIDKSPYDQNTFKGRFFHFVRLTSPLNLLATEQDLSHARHLINTYKSSPAKAISQLGSIEELWKAKYQLEASIHPDTGEKVWFPFRMAAFVPTNLLVTAGLLLPNPSVKSIIFWQWVNQSVNVGFNWANANKTTKMSMEETAMAYGSAVTASVAVAVGLGKWVQNTGLLGYAAKSIVSRFVPFVAVASAGSLNVFLMRGKELQDGINIYDDNGKVVGKSKEAGWKAVSQVAISRIATSFPCLTIPPLILSQMEKTRFFSGKPLRLGILNLGLITLTLMTALPAAIALFPQKGKISIDEVEPEIQKLYAYKKNSGNPVYFTYNKGL